MRSLFVCLTFVAGLFVVVNAQPQTMQATVSGGATQNNVYAAVGQPFFQQLGSEDGNLEFAYGIAQAQLVKDTVYDVVTYNKPYTGNSIYLPAQTQSLITSVYLVNGGIYNYDLLRTIYLIVCPEKVGTDITYDVLGVSGHCWTKQNLRTPVEGAMAYTSPMGANVPEVYGLLYTWNAALAGTEPDADGYVQGICPAENWHLPDATEINDLRTNIAEDLRSVEGWIAPNGNTNSTDFTAYPAGFYNSALARFEGLGTQTDWWMVTGTTVDGTVPPTVETMCTSSLQIPYYCDSPMIIRRNPNDAISVRCVMKNVWPE